MTERHPSGSRRVGIITFHRALNYGSVLQAYALNRFLRKRGYVAETIDFRTVEQERLYAPYRRGIGPKSLAANLLSLAWRKSLSLKRDRFGDFLFVNVPQSETVRTEAELRRAALSYDALVAGSDQIWNVACADHNSAYFFAFLEDRSRCLSYAASIGVASISDAQRAALRRYLHDFGSLSVREASAAHAVLGATGRSAAIVLDPVFLLDRDDWPDLGGVRIPKSPYIFCYFIGDVPGMRDFARWASSLSDLPLVVINPNMRDMVYRNEKFYSCGPLEFLALVRNAAMVCTNSFHALSFSVVEHKPFWVFVNRGSKTHSNSRIEHLSAAMGLDHRVLSSDWRDVCTSDPLDTFDYSQADRFLDSARRESVAFLLNALGAR